MSLKSEISANYIDGIGFVAPSPASKEGISSYNGVMYTSEYYVLLKLLKQINTFDELLYERLMEDCIDDHGLLNRLPLPYKAYQEGPDDYYGLLNGCVTIGNKRLPREILWAVIRFQGFLNNIEPGKRTLQSFLIRQPQLLYSILLASLPNPWNPLYYLFQVCLLPLEITTSIIIATSCIKAPKEDTDARRLAWHLIFITKKHSLLCLLASKIWFRRLYKTFPNGMKDVAALYYNPPGAHPFAKYWPK